MKRKMSMFLAGLMLVSGVSSVSAQAVPENAVEAVAISASIDTAVPELYEETSMPFEVEQSGDQFKVILDENPSTGYVWSAKIKDEALITSKGENLVKADTGLIGAPGKKEFSFEINSDGVSTISFTKQRSGDENPVESMRLLAYKSGDKVIVEEDKVVSINDKVEEETLSADIYYNDALIESKGGLKKIEGITMFPAADVLRAMGYNVEWKEDTRSVEISKGAQWTSITIDKNSYFKNKMAPIELSAVPQIVDGSTYVPVEFLAEILGRGLTVENGGLKLGDMEATIHSGYIKEIRHDETGTMTITISKVKDSDDINDQVIIHTSKAYTYYNKEAKVGEHVNVVCSMIMTMSIPPQTSGYVVY